MLVTKVFLDQYLVSIYVEYMYMFIHMCIINLNVSVGKYSFSCFRCYLVLKMTTSLCLSPTLRFKKAYWLYLQPIHVWCWCTVYDYIIARFPRWVCGLIYVCIYLLLIERTSSCKPLVLCFWREIALSWHSYFLFILFQLLFRSDTLYLCIPFMV